MGDMRDLCGIFTLGKKGETIFSLHILEEKIFKLLNTEISSMFEGAILKRKKGNFARVQHVACVT